MAFRQATAVGGASAALPAMQSSLAAGLSHSAAKQVSIWLGFSAGAPLALLFCCLLVRCLLFAAQQWHPLLQMEMGFSSFLCLDVLSPSAGRQAGSCRP